MALVDQYEKCEFKLAVEKFIWALQKADKKGYLDENVKTTLKPFMLPPRQVGHFHLDRKPYENTKRMHMLIKILQESTPVPPHLLYAEKCMVEVVGETGVTDEEYTAPPEGITDRQHPENLNNNSGVRQKRVANWVMSFQEEPGLKRARLHEVHYGKGHNGVIIRFSSAMDIASVIENLLAQSLKENFPTEKLMVQVA